MLEYLKALSTKQDSYLNMFSENLKDTTIDNQQETNLQIIIIIVIVGSSETTREALVY